MNWYAFLLLLFHNCDNCITISQSVPIPFGKYAQVSVHDLCVSLVDVWTAGTSSLWSHDWVVIQVFEAEGASKGLLFTSGVWKSCAELSAPVGLDIMLPVGLSPLPWLALSPYLPRPGFSFSSFSCTLPYYSLSLSMPMYTLFISGSYVNVIL